ncbi:hypothetical protein PtVF66_07120 [Legionella pneumophila]|nr:hypothetical protein PtVF66_07120 [Legionella pneumophila]
MLQKIWILHNELEFVNRPSLNLLRLCVFLAKVDAETTYHQHKSCKANMSCDSFTHLIPNAT